MDPNDRNYKPAPVENFFWHLQDIYHELKPCRFGIIVAVVGGLVFLYVEQGREVLRALAETEAGTGRTGATGGTRLLAFWTALTLWAVAGWYSTRVLLYFDFPTTQKWHPKRTPFWEWWHNFLRNNVPRFIGVAPFAIAAISFWRARGTYENAPPQNLAYFALAAAAAGIVLYILLWYRRHWLDSAVGAAAPAHDPNYEALGNMERSSLIFLAIMTVIAFVLSAMFIWNPVYFAGGLGTGAVLMFAAASWVFFGSALVYLSSWKRIPIIALLVVWIVFCSLFNDNHNVRVVTREATFERLTVPQALEQWTHRIREKDATGKHPLFIVATEGGGIRAAYWTATVLGTLQDTDESFAKHVFAISGVSGGSLGAAVFDALVADKTPRGEFAKRGQEMLGQDFLSSAIAAMFYPDLLQRFLPCRIVFLDRGRWLERGWEKAWRNTNHTNRFEDSFSDLWKDPALPVPALFLNGTSVEFGNRLIQSNLIIDDSFLDTEDAAEKLFSSHEHPTPSELLNDVRLSTAAHMSARFTYVSPAGRYRTDGSHVVDGGYFENSGAATALDILRQVNEIIQSDQKKYHDIVPQIIRISNNPTQQMTDNETVTSAEERLEQQQKIPSLADEPSSKPGTFLEDALAPVYALLHTRDARGVYADKAIAAAERTISGSTVYQFSLGPAKVPLPLGWMLSNQAAKAMQDEIRDEGLSAKPCSTCKTHNVEMLQSVIGSLAAVHGH